MNREQRKAAEKVSRHARVRLALLQALGGAVGVAVGVGVGALLTVASGSGAPGTPALDKSDVVTLPLLAGLATFAIVLLAQAVAGLVRRSVARTRPRSAQKWPEAAE